MNPARISVVIPVFGRNEYARQAIRSVLDQECASRFEIIVVDDGSPDDTAARLDDEFGSKIRLFRQENQGVSAARNRGVKESQAEYVAFLDSDDLMLPGRLAQQIEFFDRFASVGMVAGNYLRFSSLGGIETTPAFSHKPLGIHPGQSGIIRRFFVVSVSVNNPLWVTGMVRRSKFESIGGFDISLKKCEDHDLSTRFALSCPLGIIDRPLILVRDEGHERLSADKRLAHIPSPAFYEQMIDRWIERFHDVLDVRRDFRQHVARWASAVAMQYYALRKPREIRRVGRKYASLLSPWQRLKNSAAMVLANRKS